MQMQYDIDTYQSTETNTACRLRTLGEGCILKKNVDNKNSFDISHKHLYTICKKRLIPPSPESFDKKHRSIGRSE